MYYFLCLENHTNSVLSQYSGIHPLLRFPLYHGKQEVYIVLYSTISPQKTPCKILKSCDPGKHFMMCITRVSHTTPQQILSQALFLCKGTNFHEDLDVFCFPSCDWVIKLLVAVSRGGRESHKMLSKGQFLQTCLNLKEIILTDAFSSFQSNLVGLSFNQSIN